MKPIFNGNPIGSVDALARALGVSSHQLRTLAGSASNQYRDFAIQKKDGTDRKVSGPTPELKLIQRRINRQLFERIAFPTYLYGSIHDRNYVQNAEAHARAEVIIALDIKNFFPNISRHAVVGIYKNFFSFPDLVASILADLSTKDGVVPQGACTSSYLANLVFHDLESRLVRDLNSQGLTYSRLIDDITISSPRSLSKKKIESIIEQAAAMLKCRGFHLKRNKTRISSKSNPEQLMEITGLWLNRGEPRVKREERLEIRKRVRACLRESQMERASQEYHALHNRTSGQVAKLSHLSHPEAKSFRGVLRKSLPHYSPIEVKRTEKLVRAICKTSLNSRASMSYIERFHQVRYRVNIVARTNKLLSRQLHRKLSLHLPTKTKEVITHGG